MYAIPSTVATTLPAPVAAPEKVIVFPELLAVKPEAPPLGVPAKAETEAAAVLIPVVLNSSKPFELVIVNVFFVPVSDFIIRASPPLPVVSIVLACAPEISFISFMRP